MSLTQLLNRRADETNAAVWVVGVIIEADGQILLLQRRPDDFLPNCWEIPGGHVDPGESLEQALERELLEETGLHLTEVVRYVNQYDYAGEFGLTRQWNFVARATGGPIRHPEHVAYQWTSPRLIPQLLMTDEMRLTLQLFVSRRNPS